jgi:REase_AHJR-like
MSDIVSRHDKYVEQLRRQYRDDGFEELNPQEIHSQLGIGYEPDLVLKRGDNVFVFEVKNTFAPIDSGHLRQIKDMVESKPGWHFLFFTIPEQRPNAADEDAIAQANTSLSVSQGISHSYPSMAAVTLWISLETAMRQLLTTHGERPPYGTSGLSLARRLRDLGELDDDEFREIVELAEMRNRAAHGYTLSSEQTVPNNAFVLAEDLLRRAGALQKSTDDEKLLEALSSLKRGETLVLPASELNRKFGAGRPSDLKNKSAKEPGLEHRHRDTTSEINKKYGDTLISTLRKTYGADFAKGLRGESKLSDVLHRLDKISLDKLAQRSRSQSS